MAPCDVWLPAFWCTHWDALAAMALYLVPSLALALLFWIATSAHPGFFVLTFIGTLCHELAHFGVGLLTNADPVGMRIVPRRIKRPGTGHNWELGSVTFANLRWYNAAPAALAPLLLLFIPLLVAGWRTRDGVQFAPVDLLLMVLLAPQWLSFWPSPVDWRLAARSWPWLLVLACGVLGWLFWQGSVAFPDLRQS